MVYQQNCEQIALLLQYNYNRMNIHDMYVQANKISCHGITGYEVKPKYEETHYQKHDPQKVKKYETKRGSYLEDQLHAHGYIPGPGIYETKEQWKKRPQSAKVKPSLKKTFIQEIIEHEKKQKKPAPGQYQTFKSQKQIQIEKKRLSARKINLPERTSYLDGIQYEASITPGVGSYNYNQRYSTVHINKVKPQDWIKIHQKKPKIKNRQPDMGTYDPKPIGFDILSCKNKSIKGKKRSFWGNSQRFKDGKEGSGLGPGKYGTIQNQNENVAKFKPKSVYYH